MKTIISFIMAMAFLSSQNIALALDPQIAAGYFHTVGLKSDRSIVSVGANNYNQRDLSAWTNITQVCAGQYHTVGLKNDSTVVAAGSNGDGQKNVNSWTDIVKVAAGYRHTVGLKSGGAVVATGLNTSGQTNVGSWSGMKKIAAGGSHTVGLKSDGTVVAAGDNTYGQLDVSTWSNIVGIAAGNGHTVGLKSDGTVVATGCSGWNNIGQCEVGSWNNIVKIAAGAAHTIGLKADGSVLGIGNNVYGERNVTTWTDIVQVSTTYFHTVGLKSDGAVVATGLNSDGQLDVTGWNLGRTASVPKEIGVFRPSIGWWFLDANGDGQWSGCSTDKCYNFGIAEDTPVTGDWSGDGTTKIGVFRASIGWWFLDYNGNGQWDGCVTDRCYNFGTAEDTPVMGDWDGDGATEIGVFRKSIGWWFLDYNGDGTWSGCSADRCYNFGIAIDTPVTGDWNGDGKSEIGVFRPSIGWWFVDVNGDGTWSGCGSDGCYNLGIAEDLPVTGDWNSDGFTEIGVFRPSIGWWFLDYNGNDTWSGCSADKCYNFGISVDRPVIGGF